MIASANSSPQKTANPLHGKFLEMLPAIRDQASMAFRGLPSETREELTAEVVANAFVAYVRLLDRGKDAVVFATPLAMFAIKQVRSGRRVGARLNVRDVMSPYAQRHKGIQVERLPRYDRNEGACLEILVEDKRATPAEVAASRIDFGDWLQTLPRRLRQIANTLATGETTKEAAKQFGVSPGRISQLRGQLRLTWEAFQGDPAFA